MGMSLGRFCCACSPADESSHPVFAVHSYANIAGDWAEGTRAEIERSRQALQKYLSKDATEGPGLLIRRGVGRPELQNVDPFLLFDEFMVHLPAGFPDHPHCGFEAITYLLPDSPGALTHEDSCGNASTLRAGDVQWMTAGRGILHSEVPEGRETAHGLQMWLNLAHRDKLGPPAYQEIPRHELPRVEVGGVRAIVVAGEALGARSPVTTRTSCHFIHFLMAPGCRLQHPIPPRYTAFVYTLDGEATYGGRMAGAHNLLTLSSGETLDGLVVTTAGSPASFVLVAAQPIGEPIVQQGPFVMCSRDQVQQAMEDYQASRNGFEGTDSWRSQNRSRMGR